VTLYRSIDLLFARGYSEVKNDWTLAREVGYSTKKRGKIEEKSGKGGELLASFVAVRAPDIRKIKTKH